MQLLGSKHTVFVADDHKIVWVGLKHYITSEPNFEVVGEASDGLEAYHKIMRLEPEIAILDIFMPEMDGIEVVKKLSALEKFPKTILITAGEKLASFELILESNADGCLFKGVRPADLIFSLTKVLEGNQVYSKALLDSLKNGNKAKVNMAEKRIICLTKLEKEIIVRRLKGGATSKIAREMNLPVAQIKNYMSGSR